MRVKTPGREALVLFLTVARLSLAAGLCVSVWVGKPAYQSVMWLAAILLADQMDGVIARRMGIDNVNRRIADVVVDRISIHSVMAITIWCILGTFWLTFPVVLRDIVLILWSISVFFWKRSIITAGMFHRAGVFSYAVLYSVVLFTRDDGAKWVAISISVIVWFLLLDYLRAGLLIPANTKLQPIVRYQAVGLRALRGITPPQKTDGRT